MLLPQHAALLKASGISPEVQAARGYMSITRQNDLLALGFKKYQALVPALLIPIHGPAADNVLHQIRPDRPRIDRPSSKTIKYETCAGAALRLDVPVPIRAYLSDPNAPLWVTEGSRKCDSAVSQGLVCIGLPGVWGFRGTNAKRGKTSMGEWADIALNGRKVYICFDSDAAYKINVHQALEQFKEWLESRGAEVWIVYLPDAPDGSKMGLDDYFGQHGGTVDQLYTYASKTLQPIRKTYKTIEEYRTEGWRIWEEKQRRNAEDNFRLGAWWNSLCIELASALKAAKKSKAIWVKENYGEVVYQQLRNFGSVENRWPEEERRFGKDGHHACWDFYEKTARLPLEEKREYLRRYEKRADRASVMKEVRGIVERKVTPRSVWLEMFEMLSERAQSELLELAHAKAIDTAAAHVDDKIHVVITRVHAARLHSRPVEYADSVTPLSDGESLALDQALPEPHDSLWSDSNIGSSEYFPDEDDEEIVTIRYSLDAPLSVRTAQNDEKTHESNKAVVTVREPLKQCREVLKLLLHNGPMKRYDLYAAMSREGFNSGQTMDAISGFGHSVKVTGEAYEDTAYEWCAAVIA